MNFSKKKGSINTNIAFIIAMFFMVSIFIYVLMYIHPPKVYSDISQLGRKYIIKMEIDGYLTPANYSNLQNELQALGVNMGLISITATNTKVNFGDDVSLEIDYTYKKSKYTIDGFNITKVTENIPMQVKESTTSKNGS